MMKRMFSVLLIGLLASSLFAATSGKISGVITDAETGEALVGVNVIIPELGIGSATNIEGYYSILNIPPGIYDVTANYIGYAAVTVSEVRVLLDLTTNQNIQMSTMTLEGETVVIEAEKPRVQKDVASSQRNVSSDEIIDMPINSVNDVVGLQAGVEGLEIRFGDEDELALMMDGVTLKDDRTGEPISGIPLASVKEIMVQSGGFNAEYSDLQSGVISVVTREGAQDKYSFSMTYRHSPPAPKHFGMSMFDENAYFMRPYLDDDVAWTGTDGESYTDANANNQYDLGEAFVDYNGDGEWTGWDAYTQGRYPSFRGWNAVSAALLQDDDPTNDLTPQGAQRLFQWQARRQGNIVEPDFNLDAGFGGPVPFIGESLGNLRFYASVNANQNMYLVPMSRDGYRDYVGTLKLTSDISPTMKLSFSGLTKSISASSRSELGSPIFFSSIWNVAGIFGTNSQQAWKLLYPEYFCRTDIQNQLVSGKLTNQLSEKSFYEALVEYSQTSYNTNPGPARNYSNLTDIFPGASVFFADEGPFGFEDGFSSSIDGIFEMGIKSNSRDTSTTSRLSSKFDFTTQYNRFNQIKAGAQFESWNFDMNYGAINPALPVGRPFSRWEQSPWQFSVYVQDKLEFEGWIASVGLRAEYFDPNTEWYDVSEYDQILFSSNFNPDEEDAIPTKPVEGTFTVMPRLGISHPISVNSKLYFNYGHMRQKFSPDQLFGVRRVTGGQMQYYGDPTLPMEKTVAYEMGYDHYLFDKYLIHISGYYKDKTDQASTVRYRSADGTVNYRQYSNIFYQDIRGAEFEVRKSSGEWLTGFANYTYAIYSSGRFGVRNFFQNPADQREEEANYARQKQYKPLPRPRANFNLAFHTPDYFGPTILGDKLLGDWHLSFTGHWKAGAWATYGNVAGVENNVRWKDTYNVNSKLSKTYNLGSLNFTILAEAFNLFNFKHFSTAGFAVATARTEYEESLQFPQEVYEELGDRHIAGNDRLGDYRPEDVEYQPMDDLNSIYLADGSFAAADEGTYYYVWEEEKYMGYNAADGSWFDIADSDVLDALDNKAYIYNPPNESFMFLNPRDIFVGIRVSYNF